jgi:hypothetical protein
MEHFWDEMEKIAEAIRVHPFLEAFDKLVDHQEKRAFVGTGTIPQGPSPMPATAMPQTAGATNIPGMSIHCDNCNQEVSKKQLKGGKCPGCGSVLRPYRDLKNQKAREQLPEQRTEDTEYETGGEATEKEALNKDADNEYVKGAAAVRDGNPVFRIRSAPKGKPTETLKKLQKKKRFKRL